MLIDLVTKVAPAVEVVFLDTEAHFPETLAFVDDMRERFGLNLTVTKPGPEPPRTPVAPNNAAGSARWNRCGVRSRGSGPG